MVRSNLNAVELRQKPKLLFLAPSASPQARKGRTGTSCVAVAAVPARLYCNELTNTERGQLIRHGSTGNQAAEVFGWLCN